VPGQWTFYNPGGGGQEGGMYGNRDNPLNPYTGTPGTRENPISLAWGPGGSGRQGELTDIGGPFGWGRWEDFGPGVTHGDIAVGGRYAPMARRGFMPRLFESGRNFARNVGERFGGGGDRYWGRGQDMPGFIGQPGGVPYYPEGSRMSETLGPTLEAAFGGDNSGSTAGLSGDEIRNIISSDYSGNLQASTNPLDYLNPFGHTTQGGAGTGVPTQRAVGTTVGTLSNFIFPGLGFLTGPLARWATNMLQHGVPRQQVQAAVAQKQQQQPATAGGGGASPRGRFGFNVPQGWGGFGQPMGYFAPGTSGPGPLSNLNPSGITWNDVAASGVNPRYGNPNKSSVPAPGGLGGIYGQGSAGTAGIGSNYDYFGQRSLKALMSGGDTSLGFAGFRNANATPGAPTLPVAQWGGAGFGGTGLPYGTGAVNPDFAARMVR